MNSKNSLFFYCLFFIILFFICFVRKISSQKENNNVVAIDIGNDFIKESIYFIYFFFKI